MGFDGNNGFSIPYAGWGRFQRAVAKAAGHTELFETKEFSSLSDDPILYFYQADSYWVLPNNLCGEVANRIEEIIPQMDDRDYDAEALVKALKKTYEDGDEFTMF